MRRYLAWSAFGIAVFAGPLLPLIRFRENLGFILILIGFGGSVFVLIRAVVGAVSGWSARRADRATAIGILRFFVGWCAGLFVAFAIHLLRREFASSRWFPPLPVWMAGGGLALILADGVIRLRRAWLVIFFAWFGSLAAFTIAYLIIAH